MTAISLVIVTVALADLVVSAWLVAVMLTLAGEGKSAGAVYLPVEEIIPSIAFPPGTPLTAHDTSMFVVFVTVAAKVCELPKITAPLVGLTVTTMAGGGGGGGGGVMTELKPPPQPCNHALAASVSRQMNFDSTRHCNELALVVGFDFLRERNRMAQWNAGEVPAKLFEEDHYDRLKNQRLNGI